MQNPMAFIDFWGLSPESGLTPFRLFATRQEAVEHWAVNVYGTADFIIHEKATIIYTIQGESGNWYYSYTWSVVGEPHFVSGTLLRGLHDFVPEGGVAVAYAHTHPYGREFSDSDKRWAESTGRDLYAVVPGDSTDRMDILRYGRNWNFGGGPWMVQTVATNVRFAPLSIARQNYLEERFRQRWRNHVNICTLCHMAYWP